MSSILDHVEQAVPRATVYGAMKGSPVFIGKYFREINPASNATSYSYKAGNRRINIVVASPDKTIFNDLRSAYLKFDLEVESPSVIFHGTQILAGRAEHLGLGKITEPATNAIERIVIKMNGTVVEDISNFDKLTTAFKGKLLTRAQKNARQREGWDYKRYNNIDQLTNATQLQAGTTYGANNAGNCELPTNSSIIIDACISGRTLCAKLDLSGIFNCQQLLSGYYSPLEIDIYLQDPAVACQPRSQFSAIGPASGVLGTTALMTGTQLANVVGDGVAVATVGGAILVSDIVLKNVRLCMDQIVMSPEYVSAFEAALLANSSAQGIQIPFTTYYTYRQEITGNAESTFWVRKPVRYLKGVYWAAQDNRECATAAIGTKLADSRVNSYKFSRQGIERLNGTLGANRQAGGIDRWQISIGTKSYRQIEENILDNFPESQIFFSKAVGHFNDYSTESDELAPQEVSQINAIQGIDLEFSPDNDVLASETTLNSNDIRVSLRSTAAADRFRVYVFAQYQASIALFPGNETRLLVT